MLTRLALAPPTHTIKNTPNPKTTTKRYRVHAGITVDMCPFLCAQPLQILIRHAPSGASLLSLLVWHERLLYPEAGKRAAAKAAADKKAGKDQGEAAAAGDADDDDTGGVAAKFKGLLSKGWRS